MLLLECHSMLWILSLMLSYLACMTYIQAAYNISQITMTLKIVQTTTLDSVTYPLQNSPHLRHQGLIVELTSITYTHSNLDAIHRKDR